MSRLRGTLLDVSLQAGNQSKIEGLSIHQEWIWLNLVHRGGHEENLNRPGGDKWGKDMQGKIARTMAFLLVSGAIQPQTFSRVEITG